MRGRHYKNSRGFTLIEMFVAILIFSLTLTAFLLVTTRGVRSARDAANETIAQFLAQEGIELIEARRDYNFIRVNTITDWREGFVDVSGSGPQICEDNDGCYVDAFQDVADPNYITVCNSLCPLLERDNEGRYGYNLTTGEDTAFRRIITARPVSGGFEPGSNALRVISTVEWTTADGADRSVAMEKVMTNWFSLLADIEYE